MHCTDGAGGYTQSFRCYIHNSLHTQSPLRAHACWWGYKKLYARPFAEATRSSSRGLTLDYVTDIQARKSHKSVNGVCVWQMVDVNALYREEALRIRKQNSKTLRDKFGIESRNDLPDLCLLHTMVHSQNARMVELLLQNDADPNIEMSSLIERNEERVALHCAVKQGV